MPTNFTKYTNEPLIWLAFTLWITTFLFVTKQVENILTPLVQPVSNISFYAFFFCIAVAWLIFSWRKHSPHFSSLAFLTRSLTLFLPATLTLLYGISFSRNFHFLFQIGSGLLLILTLGLIFYQYRQKQPRPTGDSLSCKQWFSRQGKVTLLAVIFFTGLFFSFTTYRLGQYAAVDEPLWLYGRITKFWNNIQDQEWEKTDVSDKPGITVAMVSGAGLLRYNPSHFDDKRIQGEVFVAKNLEEMTSFFFTFRFPLVLLITLLLPLLYFLLERLTNTQNALFSYAFLTTSPILIGVSKIINPDALLWLFTTLSLLSYLVFQKRNWYRYLVLSGIFLGLALLTKYIANILFIYLLALLFLEYLYHPAQAQKSAALYIRTTLIHIGLVIFTALSTFYILLPANWPEPNELIRGTLFSQAFEKVAPLFIFIIALLLLDQILTKSRVTAVILNFFSRCKDWLGQLVAAIFVSATVFTIINTWANMKFYDFMELIASPKTIGQNSDTLGIFLTNFYPLLFSLTPLALFGLFLALLAIFKKGFYQDDGLRFAFYALIFTLVYYLGATVNGVGSIIRYQIIIFPIIALVSGIGLATLLPRLQAVFFAHKRRVMPLLIALVTLFSIFTLLRVPFPLSYASRLLPQYYYVDLKDMGPGSYEIAEQLNTLPDAENTLIWTDKDGVCQFFIGRCKRGNGRTVITDQSIQYIVISSARESRTTAMIRSRYDDNPQSVVPIHLFYEKEHPDFEVRINDRPSHYVRAFRYEQGK